jgi:hypothetical protein
LIELIFPFTYMCTQYLQHSHLPNTLSPHPLPFHSYQLSHPTQELFCPPIPQFYKKKEKERKKERKRRKSDIFVYVR